MATAPDLAAAADRNFIGSYEKLVDNSVLRQLDDSGFTKTLYRR